MTNTGYSCTACHIPVNIIVANSGEGLCFNCRLENQDNKITDQQINEAMQKSFGLKSKVNWVEAPSIDAFCMDLIREHKIELMHCNGYWSADHFGKNNTFTSKDENVIRAILLTYLKIKGVENERP